MIVMSGLRGKGKFKVRRDIYNMILAWGVLCGGRVLMFIMGIEEMPLGILLTDPLNTIVFFVSGIILAAIYFMWGNK